MENFYDTSTAETSRPTLITKTPEVAFAIQPARNSIHAMQGELETLKAGIFRIMRHALGYGAVGLGTALKFRAPISWNDTNRRCASSQSTRRTSRKLCESVT